MLQIVDYGMGNVSAIQNMLLRCGVSDVVISGDPEMVARAGKIILPGVGAFDAAVNNIEDRGLRAPLVEAASRGVPILGICLGMQLLAESSEEGRQEGLGLIPGRVRRFNFEGIEARPRVPHMGWNTVSVAQSNPLLYGGDGVFRFYFVHSYHFVCDDFQNVIGETFYGYRFASAVSRENVAGVQFHPEKSHKYGKDLLSRFAKEA
jgi:glutamine amidotransferase